mmetsp:Transcript_39699/g.95891  ORF Transcript_39699/g.95891 Transcript_39699/m.95891 type:complete len:232 (+) Transcript_39699:52-747(+)
MTPLSLMRLTTTTTRTATLAFLLLAVWLPQSVVGFANEKPMVLKEHTTPQASLSYSYRTSKLLHSSRVLPSEESSASPSAALIKAIHNVQGRLVEYRHVRKQRKLQQQEAAASTAANIQGQVVQGFVPVVLQYLHNPNKMLLQSFIMAHQQAQYDHLHFAHEEAMDETPAAVTTTSTTTTDNKKTNKKAPLPQRLLQARREAKNAKLAAKYAAIESLEERAFQICKDLGMI